MLTEPIRLLHAFYETMIHMHSSTETFHMKFRIKSCVRQCAMSLFTSMQFSKALTKRQNMACCTLWNLNTVSSNLPFSLLTEMIEMIITSSLVHHNGGCNCRCNLIKFQKVCNSDHTFYPSPHKQSGMRDYGRCGRLEWQCLAL